MSGLVHKKLDISGLGRETPLPCEECSASLSPTERFSVEVNDYLYFFCGAECFEKWRTRVLVPPSGVNARD